MTDTDAYREAIAHFATGVTVGTTETPEGRAGMTASAVASVSLDPILLLVCVNNRLPTHRALERSRRFAINVLGEGQEGVARTFATRSPDKFARVRLDPRHELPVLADAVAWFVCDVHERLPGGDHSIFIGRVRECGATRGARPLVYFRSEFGTIEDAGTHIAREVAAWSMGV
jgi:flavin reductase (DIM6/NTAB) family NADH-FMN oxidoreductase RutF